MSIIPTEQPSENSELIDLVERYLDQRLDESQGKRLEAILRDDPRARQYCAGRIRLHAELHSLARPLRIEIHEDRNLVIEQAGGGVDRDRTSIQPGQSGAIHGTQRWIRKVPESKMGIFAVGMAALVLIGWWVYRASSESKRPQVPTLAIAALENTSFEAESLKDGEIRNTVVGWETSPNKRQTAVVNPGMGRSGAFHLPISEAKLESPQVLSLTIGRDGEASWVRQRLYDNSAPAQRLQLPDLDGRTIRVELTVIRPNPEATAYAANDVFLYIGIQEELSPGRKAAIHRINSGSNGWPQANQNLGLQNDQFVKISIDLKVKAKEMRGDAFFVIGIDRKSPPGGQIYVDGISLKLLDR